VKEEGVPLLKSTVSAFHVFLEAPDGSLLAETGRSKSVNKEINRAGCDWFVFSL
jgi:hypothetical protein